MKPYNFYLNELIIRNFYVFVSFFICLLIFFVNIETVFLFELYPLTNLFFKRFIITRITDFIDVIWYLSFFLSFFFTFPLSCYQFKYFFCNSWYKYQIRLFNYLLFIFCCTFTFIYILVHSFILSLIFQFFLQWEIISDTSFLRIESEVAILSYVYWILGFKSFLSFALSWLIFLLCLLLYFINLTSLHNMLKFGRNIIFFLCVFLIFIIIPSDVTLQIVVIMINLAFFEILFFSSCFYFYKIKKSNANNSSVIKKFT